MEKTCPVTSLKLYTHKNFENIKVGDNYFTSFSMIGDSILFMKTEGDTATSDLNLLIKKREEFLDIFFEEHGKDPRVQNVVEIRDLTETYGRPDHYNKNIQTEFILSQKNRLIAYVMIGVPKVSEIIYKVGMKFIGSPIPIKNTRNYEHAMEMALEYVTDFKNRQNISNENEQRWNYSGENLAIEITVIKDNILLISGKGQLSNSYLPDIKKLVQKVFEEGNFNKDNYYRVLDYSDILGSTLRGRTGYMTIWKDAFKKYKANPIKSYVCGANPLVKTTIKLLGKFSDMQLVYVDSVETAIKYIEDNIDFENNHKGTISIKTEDIDALISFIGNIGWEMQDLGLIQNDLKDFYNPLDEVADAVKVLAGDVKSLVNNEKKIKAELEEQNKLLRIAKEEAQEANYAKSRFLDTMSHELKTPMNGMVGFIDLLMETKLNEEQKEYLSYLKHSTFSLLEKIKDILTYTDLEDHKYCVNNDFITIRDYLTQLQNKTEKQMKKDIDIQLEIDENIPQFLYLDQSFLCKVFAILINNATKFTDNGYVKIFAKFIDFDADEDKVIIQFGVEDSGIGIPMNKQNDIFDIFTQVDTKISRNYEGSGLGLSIFKKMITNINGYIDLESSEGNGSKFTFTIAIKYK